MEEQKVKEINFKSKTSQKKIIIDGTDYSKSELNTDRQPLDRTKYVECNYKFKLKSKHVQKLKDYIDSVKHFYHEEFDVHNQSSYRHCELSFPTEEDNPEIYKIISGVINEVNKKYFNYDLFETLEIQVVKYNVGGNYNWHCDYGVSANPNADRKLSLSLQLSEGSEYEGCDLIMCDHSRHYHTLERKIGCGVVFDSKTPHKVTHLIKGVRYCLVAWAHGPQLR